MVVSCNLMLVLTLKAMDPDLARFVGAKQNQVRALTKGASDKIPSIVWGYFDAVRVDDWDTATNLSERINGIGHNYGSNRIAPVLQGPMWQAINETIGAYEEFHEWDNKWLHRFGREVMSSIPKGSIFFGGTDAGRYVISVLCESQIEGKPFFIITQNQLVDPRYLQYLHIIYGKNLIIPGTNDSQEAFASYISDAQARQTAGKLKPGENPVVSVDGRVQVNGRFAVMEINGRLARTIFERNSTREIFIEQGFPIDWMYPNLAPIGPILQLHRRPLTTLSEDVVQKNSDYWKQVAADALGDWLDEKTSVREICAFCEKVYLRNDLAGARMDSAFVKNDEARKVYSKLRDSIACLYAWRARHAPESNEAERMRVAADMAFRQAYAFCPCSPEVVEHYGQLLNELKRRDDALLIAQTAARIDPDDGRLLNLLNQMRGQN
jgi:hypothetical protein